MRKVEIRPDIHKRFMKILERADAQMKTDLERAMNIHIAKITYKPGTPITNQDETETD